jgi:hypothetical protein
LKPAPTEDGETNAGGRGMIVARASPSTSLRAVSPSTLLGAVSLSNGLSNGLPVNHGRDAHATIGTGRV